MRKKMRIFLTILVTLTINNSKVIANESYTFNAGTDSSGKSIDITTSPCGPGETCLSMLGDFHVRITMVDENRNRVKGTRTVQFFPYQPSENGYHGEYDYYDVPNFLSNFSDNYGEDCFKSGDKKICYYRAIEKKDASYIKINPGKTENFLMVGSNIPTTGYGYVSMMPDYSFVASNGQNRMAINSGHKEYGTFMGFGMNKPRERELWNYSTMRTEFLNYVTNLNSRLNYVFEEKRYVNFVDFFLHVSGFSDSWSTTQDDKEGYEKITSGKYYLVIEPVYTVGTSFNGYWHSIEGTAKQIAGFTAANYYESWCIENDRCKNNANRKKIYFGAGYDEEYLYNMFCNFMDAGTKIPFTLKYAENANQACDSVFRRKYGSSLDKYYGTLDVLNTLKDPESPYGVNIVDVTALMRTITGPEEPMECAINLSSCENDNLIFSSAFTAKRTTDKTSPFTRKSSDIYNCIDNMSESEKEKYFYKVEAGGKNLYCYDDISYNFNDVKQALQNKNFNSGTFIEVPNGELHINRYCYSKDKITDTVTLQRVLSDDIEGKNYQNSFSFNFNGNNYSFKRVEKNNSIDVKEPEKIKQLFKTRAYLYTSSIGYEYELDSGVNGQNAFINVNTFELNDALSTNSIKFITQFNDSKIIKAPKIENYKQEYDNSITGQITNGYGLSTKMIEQIKQKATTINDTSEEKTVKKELKSTLSMLVNEDKNKTCGFRTEVTNSGIGTGTGTGIGNGDRVQFRVISLTNPFPARDGTSRLPGNNWLNDNENNVYTYIQNNRNVKSENKDASTEAIYQKEPLYTITLTPSTMVKIREYNKSHTYSDFDMTCENGTGRMCIDNFIRDNKYLPSIEGTCSSINAKEITNINNRIIEFEKSGCNNYAQCMTMKQSIVNELDFNKDNYVTSDDLLNADFYTCADKTALSGK